MIVKAEKFRRESFDETVEALRGDPELHDYLMTASLRMTTRQAYECIAASVYYSTSDVDLIGYLAE